MLGTDGLLLGALHKSLVTLPTRLVFLYLTGLITAWRPPNATSDTTGRALHVFDLEDGFQLYRVSSPTYARSVEGLGIVEMCVEDGGLSSP